MLQRVLADLVLVVHLAFVVFAILGGLLALRWRWMPWLHLPAVAWGVAVELAGWICPLTPLENSLRQAGGGTAYAGDFIHHYLVPLLYPAALTRLEQIVLGAGLFFVNAVVYAVVVRRTRRARLRA